MIDRQLLLEEIKQHFDEGLPFTEEHRIAAESDPGIAALLAELDQLSEDFAEEEVYHFERVPAELHAGIMNALAAAQNHGFKVSMPAAHGKAPLWVKGLLPVVAIFGGILLYHQLNQQGTINQGQTPNSNHQAVLNVPLPKVSFDPLIVQQRERMMARGRDATAAAEGFLRSTGGLIPKLNLDAVQAEISESNPS
ncbi:MAG: hypothetical protein ACFCU1_00010 [Sumerlaeia bacterium]